MGQELDNASLLSVIQTQEQIVASGLNLEAVMDLVVERAQALTEASAGVIEMVDGDDMVYTAVAGTAEGHSGLRLKVGGSLSGTSVVENEVLHCSDARRDGRVDRAAAERLGAISVVCAPLLHQGRPVGVLKVYDPEPRAFSDADVTILGLLSRVIAAHMAHATDFEAAHRDGRHDGLTGLPNRRFFDEHLNGEVARARRLGSPLTLCLFDLDGFKGLNDRLGHAAGRPRPAGDRAYVREHPRGRHRLPDRRRRVRPAPPRRQRGRRRARGAPDRRGDRGKRRLPRRDHLLGRGDARGGLARAVPHARRRGAVRGQARARDRRLGATHSRRVASPG